jgi:probable addiction module antidote protein
VIVMLAGGDKSSQTRDIEAAKQMAKEMKMADLTPFEASEFLDNEDTIAAYLTAALEEGNPDLFLAALGDVAKVRGMADVAAVSGLGRESLYKALKPGSKLRFETVQKVLAGLGVRFLVEPA